MLENILNLDKNFKRTKLPGKSFIQNFLGKFDENVDWPRNTPKINGFIEKDPVICLLSVSNFFLVRNIDTVVERYLSQIIG
jgi:hypothetical protein